MPLSLLRQTHALRIFHAIRTNPGIQQKDIRELTGAERSTVSAILQGFENANLVKRVRGVSKSSGRGRPADGYQLSPEGGLLIGVQIRPHEIRYVGSGLDGAPLTTIVMPQPEDITELGKQVLNATKAICLATSNDEDRVRAIGVSVPGIVDREGCLQVSPNLELKGVEIGKLLRAELSTPVFVENNSAGAAMAVQLFGRDFEGSDFLYIESGIGVGGGFILNGELHRGFQGFAGEIGHTKIVQNGRKCRCGNNGCLSAYTADPNILARAAEKGLNFPDMSALLAAAKSGDGEVINHLRETGGYLGFGLANVVHLLDVPEIILGGTFARAADYMMPAVEQALDECLLAPFKGKIKFSNSPVQPDAPLGGVAVALDGFSNIAEGRTSVA